MGLSDVAWLVVIIGGTAYLLYRSFFKKKGGCDGCSGCSCHQGRAAGQNHLHIAKEGVPQNEPPNHCREKEASR